MGDTPDQNAGHRNVAPSDWPPVFSVSEALMPVGPVVAASPHSGRFIPPELREETPLSDDELRASCDPFVDQLLADVPRTHTPLIAAQISRAYLDLNRSANDLDPSMFDGPVPQFQRPVSLRSKAGYGVIPRIAAQDAKIYRHALDPREATERIARVHTPYYAELKRLLERAHDCYGFAILVDTHSMPSTAPAEVLRGRALGDIVLGDRHGEAAPKRLVDFVAESLASSGLKVERNRPYAGGYATELHGTPRRRRYALQIEINRALYMDEESGAHRQGFGSVRDTLTDLFQQLNIHARDILRH